MNLLTENIIVILNNSERILSDKRMFFAQLPVDSYFAKNLCLGELLEWWKECKGSNLFFQGKRWYVYHLVGNPMTGSNFCGIVSKDSTSTNLYIPEFKDLWHSLANIAKKYREEKRVITPYTLDEVIEMLKSEK